MLHPRAATAWRLSVARLEEPAEFSPLPGVQRTFMVLDGALALVVDGRRHELAPRMTLKFSGDSHVVLDELPVPCHALNLMVRGARSGRITAADEPAYESEEALAAFVVPADETGGNVKVRDALVATPGITPITPEPYRKVEHRGGLCALISPYSPGAANAPGHHATASA